MLQCATWTYVVLEIYWVENKSGFISEIGFEIYHKILDEALQELKGKWIFWIVSGGSKTENLFSDCQIDTDLEILLPSDFVNSVAERLVLYKDLDSLQSEEQLTEYESKLRQIWTIACLQKVVEYNQTQMVGWKTGFWKNPAEE